MTGWSQASSSPTDPSPTMEVCIINVSSFSVFDARLHLDENLAHNGLAENCTMHHFSFHISRSFLFFFFF